MLDKLKTYRNLLKNKDTKKIVGNYLKQGYSLTKSNKETIVLTKYSEFLYEVVEIYDGSFINHVVYEKRPNGIIITKLYQSFDYTAYSKDQKQLVYLVEKQYVFTNSKLIRLLKNIESLSLEELYQKMKTIPIELDADMKTCFSAYLDYLTRDFNEKMVQSFKILTKVKVNIEDISFIYQNINGNDKLYRIYDLYRGIINERDQYDIISLSSGELNPNAFGLKELKRITSMQRDLVGNSIIPINDEHREYLKIFFEEQFGYVGDINLDRNALLNCIMCNSPHHQVEGKSPKQKTYI